MKHPAVSGNEEKKIQVGAIAFSHSACFSLTVSIQGEMTTGQLRARRGGEAWPHLGKAGGIVFEE